MQYGTVQCSTVQYSTVLYCTVLHCTVLYCTAEVATINRTPNAPFDSLLCALCLLSHAGIPQLISSTVMVTARMAKLKAELVNILYTLPEKPMRWTDKDEVAVTSASLTTTSETASSSSNMSNSNGEWNYPNLEQCRVVVKTPSSSTTADNRPPVRLPHESILNASNYNNNSIPTVYDFALGE